MLAVAGDRQSLHHQVDPGPSGFGAPVSVKEGCIANVEEGCVVMVRLAVDRAPPAPPSSCPYSLIRLIFRTLGSDP